MKTLKLKIVPGNHDEIVRSQEFGFWKAMPDRGTMQYVL
jgi:hypothetical protein